jgi:hypothetical protein
MTMLATSQVDCEKYHAGLPVTDLMAAVDFYTKKSCCIPASHSATVWPDRTLSRELSLRRIGLLK